MKLPFTEFAYNNSVHNTINISLFFAIYDFHSNVSSSVRDDHPKGEILIAREKVKTLRAIIKS
jgi:hypothetical protein